MFISYKPQQSVSRYIGILLPFLKLINFLIFTIPLLINSYRILAIFSIFHIELTTYTFLLRYKLYQYENLCFLSKNSFMLDIKELTN
uniref:Uncharacterized protein n=1 Tax=Wolbachia endosymbiont of Aleurodicus dispersus TaxID=1288877 RepID=A0A3B0IVC7_9RICK